MNFIEKLQNKPYETRVKILWGTILVVGAGLVILFIFNLKSTIGNVDGSKLLTLDTTEATQQTQVKYGSVEKVESTSKLLNVYFNLNNETTDILNAPKLNDFTLTINGQQIKPVRVTNRQGSTFPSKILSHSQNFGILTFPATDAKSGELTFDQMYFEQNSSNIFQQTLDLDFNKLIDNGSVRN